MAGEPTTRQRHVRCAQAQSCRPLGDDELTVVIRPYIDEGGGELQAAYNGGMGVVRLERPWTRMRKSRGRRWLTPGARLPCIGPR